jgi:hypothetical protein
VPHGLVGDLAVCVLALVTLGGNREECVHRRSLLRRSTKARGNARPVRRRIGTIA